MSNLKGIILSGGSGSRMAPMTQVVNKQLLPIFDKPMVYYPLSVLMLTGIREILLISSPEHLPLYEKLLGDGSQWGLDITYKEQPRPEGLAQALIIGEEFVGDDRVALVLGDNVLYGHGLEHILGSGAVREDGATVFGAHVEDPERYGVVEFDEDGRVVGIEEKPAVAKSNFAVIGLYFYPRGVAEIAKTLMPSERGELEITALNNAYLDRGQLYVKKLSRGIAWLDTGTDESLLDAANFVHSIQKRQGLRVACPEEIAFRKEFTNREQLLVAADEYKNKYGDYLRMIADE